MLFKEYLADSPLQRSEHYTEGSPFLSNAKIRALYWGLTFPLLCKDQSTHYTECSPFPLRCKDQSTILSVHLSSPLQRSEHYTEYSPFLSAAKIRALYHRVDSVIESSLRSKIMHWIIWAETFVRWRWMITNQFLKIWLLSVSIINV